jgi:AsmA protein
MGRLAKILLGIVGVVVLLLVGLTLLLQSGAVSNRVKDLVVPRASTALGRELTVADAKLSLFPSPGVALRGAKLAGRPNEPALAEMDSLDVGVAFWPLATSLGKDVRVTHIALVKPVLNLVRARDGTWNYEGLGGEAKSPPPAKEPSAEKAKVVVEKATIQDGTVRYIDHLTGEDAKVALQKIDLDASNVGLGLPLDAKLSAAIAGEEKNFEAQVHASRLPESAAELGPGHYPELQGTLALKGLDLARFRAFFPSKVTRIMTGGRVDADAKLATQDQKYVVDGGGKLSQVRLRGDPAQGGFKVHASADPASGAAQAKLSDIVLKGPGIDLTGTATADTKPERVRFAFQGSTLDLAHVMALAPQDQQEKPKGAPLLTAEQRRAVEALDVQGTVALQKVVRGAFAADDFKADLALDKGAFVVRQGSAKFFGGNVDAAGTRFDLSQALPTWNLKAKLQGVDLAKAMSAFTGVTALTGETSGVLDLDGAGVDWNALKKALTGQGALALKDGSLTTADLGGSVLGALAKGLQAVGKGGLAHQLTGDGKTSLEDLAASFTVADGALKLSRALSFTAPFGAANLGGKIGLGGELGLDGTATVSKEALAQVAGGSGIPLPSGLQVPLALGGTLTQPTVSVNASDAVANLVSGAAKAKAAELKQDVTKRAQDEAKKGVGDILKNFGVGGK